MRTAVPPFSLLTPWFLVGAAAAAVPVVLHLFARETATTVPFSAVHLLEATPVEQTRRRRVTDLLLLALRMAILALLAVAFARPYLVSAAADHRRPVTIVALDVSASMGAPSTWSAAVERAGDAVDAAPAGNLVALATFAAGATVVVGPTTDRAAARAAVDEVVPGSGPTRLGAALDLVPGLAAGRQATLVVVSDLPASIAAEPGLWLPDGAALRLESVAAPPADLRVLSVRRAERGVSALVESEGEEPRETTVSMMLDGEVLERKPLSVAPAGAVEVTFDSTLPERGTVSVRVEDAGGRPAGDERFMVLDEPPPVRVLVVEPVGSAPEAALYVREALAADPVRSFSVSVRAANDAILRSPDWIASTDAVVVLGTRGLDRRAIDELASYVRQGGGLLVAAGPLTEPLAIRDIVGPDMRTDPDAAEHANGERLIVAASRHPLALPFEERAGALAGVRLERTVRLVAPEEGVVLRLSSGGAALAEARHEAGRVLVFASDLSGEWNDLPRHAAFVPFIAEVVRFAAGRAAEPDGIDVGERGAADTPGVAAIGSPARRVAVNAPGVEFGQPPLDPSAVERMVARRPFALAPAPDAREEEERAPLWRGVLLVACLLLVVEGLVAAARGRRAAGATP